MAYVKPPVGDVIEGLFVPKHSGQGAVGNAIAFPYHAVRDLLLH